MEHELYRELIIGHYTSPCNFGRLEEPTHQHHIDNPVCGDALDVELRVQDDVVTDIAFSGEGCAISMAAASLLTEDVKGQSLDAIRAWEEADMFALLEVPITYTRRKCALLCYTALQQVIEEQ